MVIESGQYIAYEVRKQLQPYWDPKQTENSEPVATVWDKGEALKLSGIVNRNCCLGDDQRIRQIGVIVLDTDVYYDVAKPPVPIDLVASTAEEAVLFYAGAKERSDILYS